MTFSNKGLIFGAAWRNSETSRLFDLRKMDVALAELVNEKGSVVNTVDFDSTGAYFVQGTGNGLKMHAGKTWTDVVASYDTLHDGLINSVR